MTIDLAVLAAIAAMAVATAATRLAGLVLPEAAMRRPRVRAVLDAVPPAVLAAIIAPTVIATGPAETLAAAITVVAALRLPLVAVVVVGVASAALLRQAGL